MSDAEAGGHPPFRKTKNIILTLVFRVTYLDILLVG